MVVVGEDGSFPRRRVMSFEIVVGIRADIAPTGTAQGHPGFGAALVDHQAWLVVTVEHG